MLGAGECRQAGMPMNANLRRSMQHKHPCPRQQPRRALAVTLLAPRQGPRALLFQPPLSRPTAAGNQSFLGLLDSLHMAFAEGCVVMLKYHPIMKVGGAAAACLACVLGALCSCMALGTPCNGTNWCKGRTRLLDP